MEILFAMRLEDALKVRAFISKEPTRYYLNGIHVEDGNDGGAIAVATDGHRMGISFSEDGLVNEKCIVAIPSILKPEKAFMREWLIAVRNGKNDYIAVVPGRKDEENEDTAQYAISRIEECRVRFGRCLIDGTFPEWKRVLPDLKADAASRTFNKDYIASFGKCMTVTGNDEASPHLVTTSDKNFVGVLMPMRTEGRKAAPEWLNAKQTA